jgi:hypothetical protein
VLTGSEKLELLLETASTIMAATALGSETELILLNTRLVVNETVFTAEATVVANTVPPTWPTTKDCWLSFSVVDVSKTFERVNSRRAAGPDGILSRVLRACAEQLAGVFTDIFNLSLFQSAVPTCFKMATIVQEEYLCKNAVR